MVKKISYILVLLLCYCAVNAQLPATFSELESYIEENISNDHIDKNLALVQQGKISEIVQSFNCKDAGRIYHLIGVSYYSNHQELEAIKYFKKAVYENWDNCPEVDPKNIVNSLFNIGVSYQYIGDMYTGKEYLDTAIILMENIEDFPKEDLATKYEAIGYYYIELNDFYRARNFLRQAATLEEHIDPYTTLSIRINQMILYNQYKKKAKAKEIYLKTKELFKAYESEFDDDIKLIYYLNVASVQFSLGNLDKSEAYISKALDLAQGEDYEIITDAKEILGSICLKRKDYECALKNFREVNQYREDANLAVKDSHAESIALHNLSEAELLVGNDSIALALINKSIEKITPKLGRDEFKDPILNEKRINNPELLISHMLLKDKILKGRGNGNTLNNRYQILSKVDTLIDKSMQSLNFEDSKLELLPIIQTQTEQAINVCHQLYKRTQDRKYLSKAFYFSSQAKSYILQQTIQENQFLRSKATPEVQQNIQDARINIARIRNEQILNNSDSLANLLVGQEIKLEHLIDSFTNSVKSTFWDNKRDYSIADIQDRIPSDQVLLDTYEGVDHVYMFWITSDEVLLNMVSTNSLLPAIDSLSWYNRNPSIPYNSSFSREVYQYIFADNVQEILPNNYRLKVIPEGRLFDVSFATLIDNDQNLMLETTPISYAYNPNFLFFEHKEIKGKDFIGFGTHYTPLIDEQLRHKKYIGPDESLGMLSTSEKEVEICNDIMQGDIFLGKEATLENFKNHASGYNVIYLSLHGVVDEDEGQRTGVIFDNSKGKFVLDGHDLLELKLNADLIVMSSCHSASGKTYKGEGLKGMTRSFFASGARNVLSSLWTAGENSTMEILPKFLKNYKAKMAKDKSLQASKLAYLENNPPLLSHPFYWGNIVLYSSFEPSNPYPYLYPILGALLLLLLGYIIYRRQNS